MIDQTLPFHDSTKVCEMPLVSVLEYPTAVQFAALTQDTAWSTDSVLPLGLGLGMIDQDAAVPRLDQGLVNAHSAGSTRPPCSSCD